MKRTISDLIEAAGGAGRLEEASRTYGRPITAKGVYKWKHIGIPQWHWPMMMALTRASERELLAVNQALSRRKHGSRFCPNSDRRKRLGAAGLDAPR